MYLYTGRTYGACVVLMWVYYRQCSIYDAAS